MNGLPCHLLMLKIGFDPSTRSSDPSTDPSMHFFTTYLCKSGETRFLFLRTWSFVGTPDVAISRWFCPLFISVRLFKKLLVGDDGFGIQSCCWVPGWIKSSALSRGEYDSASSETLCRRYAIYCYKDKLYRFMNEQYLTEKLKICSSIIPCRLH